MLPALWGRKTLYIRHHPPHYTRRIEARHLVADEIQPRGKVSGTTLPGFVRGGVQLNGQPAAAKKVVYLDLQTHIAPLT